MAVAVAELDVRLAELLPPGDGVDDALAAGAGLNHCKRSMNVVRMAVGASQMAAFSDASTLEGLELAVGESDTLALAAASSFSAHSQAAV